MQPGAYPVMTQNIDFPSPGLLCYSLFACLSQRHLTRMQAFLHFVVVSGCVEASGSLWIQRNLELLRCHR